MVNLLYEKGEKPTKFTAKPGEEFYNVRDKVLYTVDKFGAVISLYENYYAKSTLEGQTPYTAIYLLTSDLNNVQEVGFYYQTANVNTSGNNYPTDSAGSLLVQKSAGVTQQYTRYNDGAFYTRGFYNGTWSAWLTH